MQPSPSHGNFALTRWTLVLRASAASPEGRAALSELCDAYYQPVFVFMRRLGFDADTARDHTHSFFAHLLERGFPGPDPARGRFRNYLLGAVKYFVGDLQDGARREKRGGGAAHMNIDLGDDASPALMIADPGALMTPELFDREWAVALMNRAIAVLADEQSKDRPEQFEALRPWLMGDEITTHSETACALGMSEGAVKVAVHRLRKRFRQVLRLEIAQTLDNQADVEDELRYLCSVLR